jgi:uncharacterized protein (DUF2141 family)
MKLSVTTLFRARELRQAEEVTMKSIRVTAWIALGVAFAIVGQTHVARATGSGAIAVTVDGFRNTTGQARVAVFNQRQGFPDGESDAFRRTVAAIEGGRVQVRFDDLPYGEYAVSMYHDENGDQKLNKKIFGIPTEGYGVSNNVVHGMRSPKFAEAKFVLAEVEREIQIHVHY